MKLGSPRTERLIGQTRVRAAWHYRVETIGLRLLIYALLFGGSAIFALPFLWMVGTSFKVDRELFTEHLRLWPTRPVPAAISPYLDPSYYPAPKTEPDRRGTAAARAWLDAHPEAVPDLPGDRERSLDLLAAGLWRRVSQLLPGGGGQLPPTAFGEAVRGRLNDELVAEVARRLRRAFCLGPVRVRSLDLEEVDLLGDQSPSAFWHLDADVPASLVDEPAGVGSASCLQYDFSEPGRGEVRLAARVRMPFPPDRLYRLQLFLQPDDSWHRMDLTVEYGGHRYRARRHQYLGDFNWQVVTYQPYSPDDRSTKIRFWNPLMDEGVRPDAEREPGMAKLVLTLRENSQQGAWWAKCTRNYVTGLTFIPFWRYAATSVFLVVLNVFGTLLSCSLVAFSFARLRWPGRSVLFGIMLATMMIPGQVTMIPQFLIIRRLGWYNSLFPLWVGSFLGGAFNIFLLRQFMRGIPRDLEDAARIDGCNSLQVYRHVMLPLIKPTLACIAIFTFLGVWNDFMGPLIYLNDQRLYPLSLGLYALNVQAGGSYGMMMASAFLVTLPVIVVFFFAQKYFIQGITLTGIRQ